MVELDGAKAGYSKAIEHRLHPHRPLRLWRAAIRAIENLLELPFSSRRFHEHLSVQVYVKQFSERMLK